MADPRHQHSAIVILLMVCVSITGTANSFSGRIRAEAFGKSDFIVVVFDAMVYFVFNAVAVMIAAHRGTVTWGQVRFLFKGGWRWEQLGLAKFLVFAGICDVADSVTGFAAQPYLTALVMSLMNQATVPFTVLISMLVMGVRYSLLEYGSILLVIAGAVICVLVADSTGGENNIFWAIFAALTTSFAAASFVLKEKTFSQYSPHGVIKHSKPQLQTSDVALLDAEDSRSERAAIDRCGDDDASSPEEEELELSIFLVGFIVGSVGLLSCVPIALLNQAMTTSDAVWPAFKDGLKCLFNCENALSTYAVYAVINVSFNVSLLLCTAYSSALLTFLSLKMMVPLVAVLSPVDWPLIGSHPVTAGQWGAMALMLLGIALFRYGNIQREQLSAKGLQNDPLLSDTSNPKEAQSSPSGEKQPPPYCP